MIARKQKRRVLLVGGVLIAGISFWLLAACRRSTHPAQDYAYQYQLVAQQPLACYSDKPPTGLRRPDIPVGETITAESASYLTGVAAYSQVIYRQKVCWVFDALSKTRVLRKEKVAPVYRKMAGPVTQPHH